MTKYKWLFLGLIVSIILFLLFLISPLTNFINSIKIIPAEPLPELIIIELESANLASGNIFDYRVYGHYIPKEKIIKVDVEDIQKFEEMANNDYEEWYRHVPKRIDWSGLHVFMKSFYNLGWIGLKKYNANETENITHTNLFWIPIIIFSVLMANYKKEPDK